MGMQVYLDNAATTVQKPRAVSRAVRSALRKSGSPGRGTPSRNDRGRAPLPCRALAAELFRVDSPHKIVFTHNATCAQHCYTQHSEIGRSPKATRMARCLSRGMNNAVLRPLHGLRADGVTTVPVISLLLSRKSFA